MTSTKMTAAAVEELLEKDEDCLQPAVLIRFQGMNGIVIKLGETLSRMWQSCDIIVFWSNGDHTVLHDPGGDIQPETILEVFEIADSPLLFDW